MRSSRHEKSKSDASTRRAPGGALVMQVQVEGEPLLLPCLLYLPLPPPDLDGQGRWSSSMAALAAFWAPVGPVCSVRVVVVVTVSPAAAMGARGDPPAAHRSWWRPRRRGDRPAPPPGPRRTRCPPTAGPPRGPGLRSPPGPPPRSPRPSSRSAPGPGPACRGPRPGPGRAAIGSRDSRSSRIRAKRSAPLMSFPRLELLLLSPARPRRMRRPLRPQPPTRRRVRQRPADPPVRRTPSAPGRPRPSPVSRPPARTFRSFFAAAVM